MQDPPRPSPMTVPVRLAALTAQAVLVAATLAAVAAAGLAALGAVPWLALPLAFEGGAPVEAGPAVQTGLAGLLVALCGFLPASVRVMRLDASHRRFQASMEDVARAYYAAHAADRSGAFHIASEFDAVRERLAFLRGHPELSALEPEVLELAAQMGHVGRDLARVYADDKVAAAREALAHRGDQASRIEADAARALRATTELQARLAEVEGQEVRTTERIEALRAELDALLPRLGLGSQIPGRQTLPIPTPAVTGQATQDDGPPVYPSIAVVRG